MKSRLRALAIGLAFVMLIGIAGAYRSRLPDQILVAIILAVYVVGSAVLLFRSRSLPPEGRRRIFSCGVLALLPASWRRWVLDEKPPGSATKLLRCIGLRLCGRHLAAQRGVEPVHLAFKDRGEIRRHCLACKDALSLQLRAVK